MTRSRATFWPPTAAPPASPEQRRELVAKIVDGSHDAIIATTLDGLITIFNRSAEIMYGWWAAEVIGSGIDLLVPLDRRAELFGLYQRLSRGEHIPPFSTTRIRKDGQHFEVSLCMSPIRDDGRLVGASIIARDVTTELEATRQLEHEKQMAEAASRAKDHFLAVLSHELRTPLTPVVAAATMLERRNDLPATACADIAMIRRNVELEAHLIDDLLDLTRITKNKLELSLEPVNIATLLEETIAICSGDIRERELVVTLEVEGDGLWVSADAGRLRQVFWNLLKNALKFTPRAGRVCLAARRHANRIQVVVADTGVGIEPEDLVRIFDAFEQAGAQRAGGLGLGLAISKALVELHGGSIRVHSAGRDRGSSFVVDLPATHETLAPVPPTIPAASLTPSLRILLVEDDDDSRETMARLLQHDGHDVHTAACIAEALAWAEQAHHDLLLSDLGLPDGSGLELMQKLTRTHPDLWGVALSGYGMQDDVRASRAAGFAAHLIKPVNPRELALTIGRVALGLRGRAFFNRDRGFAARAPKDSDH